ncbi:SCP2 sterol-binding domain-containing protein [Neobacillus pocheonensis]|uniref:SCP2 sterol-binding domain-containing protein n=1 Tax=Neobacillus pocheonensis TaxID=363869 RepID=A0ABT0WFF9_9BACI|nr:SCP2 sterol-binding domain-containing protein [Neobacillus pocheonensis]
MIINVTLSDNNQNFTMYLENSVLINKMNKLDFNPNVSLVSDKRTFYMITSGKFTTEQAMASGNLNLTGDQNKLLELLSLFDHFTSNLNIVTP